MSGLEFSQAESGLILYHYDDPSLSMMIVNVPSSDLFSPDFNSIIRFGSFDLHPMPQASFGQRYGSFLK